jgi:glycosyltransferase involved in cell wall biosynthesis
MSLSTLRPPRAEARARVPRMPRNVLFVENALGFGGSTVAMGMVLSRLDLSRFRPFVVVSQESHRDWLRRRRMTEAEIEVITMPAARFTGGGGWAKAALATLDHARRTAPYARRIHDYAREREVDLVHLNNSVLVNLGGILAARKLGVPCVIKQHGFEWHSREVRWAARGVRHFMPCSEDVAGDLQRLGVSRDRMTTTYCPIDVARHDVTADGVRAELGIPEGVPAFGIAGCLQEWKGQHVFLEAAAQVLARLPQARAVVLGAPPAQECVPYERRLREMAALSGFADRIVFTGHRDDTPRVLAAVDVWVHASVIPEPFGMVVGEAMAARKPVIAAKAGGPIEIVDDGVTGLLTTPGDVDQLAQALLRLLADPHLRACMGAAGRLRVSERFGLDRHVELTQRVYERALAAPVRTETVGA